MLLTPAELREQSDLYRQAAEKEATLEIKRRLASHALALAQLAERIKRDKFVAESNVERYRRMLTQAPDAAQRSTIERLLQDEEAKLAGSMIAESS
ncbi:MAG: hypothetical protein ACLQJR_06255 [Stellaceae bacterium]